MRIVGKAKVIQRSALGVKSFNHMLQACLREEMQSIMFHSSEMLLTHDSDLLQELGSYYCDDEAGYTRSSSVGRVIPYFLSFCLPNWEWTYSRLLMSVLVYSLKRSMHSYSSFAAMLSFSRI